MNYSILTKIKGYLMKQKTLKLNVLPLLIAGAISMHSASAMAIGELVNLGSYSGDPQGIATYSGDPQGIATAINDDGTVMVGGGWDSGSSTAWRFTASTGYENLEINSVGGISKSIAYDVSETGDVVVGGATTSAGDFAFRWTAATGLVDIGVLQGGDNATAYGVNYDGSKIVGESEISINNDGYINGYHAFLWFNNSMADLGTLGGRNSVAYSISKDGNVVVGESETGSTHSTKGHKIKRAFKYHTTNDSRMVDLGVLAAGGGEGSSIANGVNFDGSVIVGASEHTLGNHAVQWTSAGVQDLHGAAGEYSEAFNVNDAGDVIVGSMDTLAGAGEVRRA
ncbi:MAG: hypothetical protein PSN44_06320, partial [Gammaproteobacteria bacterium]|nr:hypothetical protein [Gammaproteobacteria bacterium]